MDRDDFHEHEIPRYAPFRIVGMVFVGLFLAVVFGFAFGWAVMLLWNWLMPALFGLKVITYWQGFGLVVLARLMLGGFGHHGHYGPRHPHQFRHHHWKAWKRCHDDDDEWNPGGSYRNWKYYREYWREEGRAAFVAYLEKTGKVDKSGKDQ